MSFFEALTKAQMVNIYIYIKFRVKCRLELRYTRATTQNVVHKPEALTSSGSLLEMQIYLEG